MRLSDRIKCRLIGWDSTILSQCGEASKRMLNKYTSAICIMSILWGTIGYVFANRYLGIAVWWQCLIIGLVFAFIVIQIEKIIILNTGRNVLIGCFRIGLALCMALLGSFIFDQIMFQNDLEAQIKNQREEQIKRTIATRTETCDLEIATHKKERSSLKGEIDSIYTEISQRPLFVSSTSTTYTTSKTEDQVINTKSKTTNQIQNPTIRGNLERIKNLQNKDSLNEIKIRELETLKYSIDEDVRKDFENRPVGFLEELAASLVVLTQSWLTILFWCLLFGFMMFLELFVVSIKFGEQKCEYDLVVEHQLGENKYKLEKARHNLTT